MNITINKYLNYEIIILIIIFIIILLFTYNENFNNVIIFNENAIVIVEPREHKLLEQVIDNFDNIMDKSWDLYVFHGKSHTEFANNATKKIQGRNKFLIPLETDNLTAPEYNRLFKDISFWNNVKAEHILIFQTDSVLCKNSPYKIEDFMKYDYIGCPYNDTFIGKIGKVWSEEHNFYGIGGLSYRNKSFMIDCINKHNNIDSGLPEDVLFSNCVADTQNKPETAKILNKFCTQFHGLDKSFGVHRPINLSNKEKFSEYCPEINILY
jgi:hypothetical protein